MTIHANTQPNDPRTRERAHLMELIEACTQDDATCSTFKRMQRMWSTCHPAVMSAIARDGVNAAERVALHHAMHRRPLIDCDCPTGFYCSLRLARRAEARAAQRVSA